MGDGYQQFTTHGLPAVERIDSWERHNASALLPLSVRSLNANEFEATEENLRLPRIDFARVQASPHVVERADEHISRGADGGVALYFSFVGEAFFYHRDGVQLQRPGTMLICDVSRPFMRGFAQGLQELVATVPRQLYEHAVGAKAPREPIVRSFADTPGGDQHAGELAQLIRRTLAEPSDLTLATTEGQVLDLLQRMLAPEKDRGGNAHCAAALSWIKRNLRDPSISVVSVAKAVGVSERTLSRAFAERGATVARLILELRLELAHRVLSQPGAPSVRDVAISCGFVSAGHFSRVFRKRYDQTPAEVAALAGLAHSS